MITCHNLTFKYPDEAFPIFNNFSIGFSKGKISAVLGPNGCGKSTLFHLAYGWLTPQKGAVSISEQSINSLSRQEIGKRISILPQHEKLPFQLTAYDYVLLGRTPHLPFWEMPKDRDHQITQNALERIGAGHLSQKNISQLSGGEQQLIFIARVLAQETSLLLLDEVTTHLDLFHIKTIFTLINELKKEGKTLILTLHDPTLAAAIADEVVLMFPDGSYSQGLPSDILTTANLSKAYHTSVPILHDSTHFLIDWETFIHQP